MRAVRVTPVDEVLDRLCGRLKADRWVLTWSAGDRWDLHTPDPSLRDELLRRLAPGMADTPGLSFFDVGELGDTGSRLAASGVDSLIVISRNEPGRQSVTFLESPDPTEAGFLVDGNSSMIADLDLAAIWHAGRQADELQALFEWLPALSEVYDGALDPETATSRLADLLDVPLNLTLGGTAPLGIEVADEDATEPAMLDVFQALLQFVTSQPTSRGETRRNLLLQERARIASVIHEGITQVLTNVSIQLEVLDHVLEDPDTARQMIRGARDAVLESLDSIRTVILDLNPATSDWADITTGLERYAADFGAQWGMEIDVTVQGIPRQVAPDVVSVVFAFVQEGLTNVRKHAGTESAAVTLRFDPETIRVVVADSGVGIDPDATDADHLRRHQGLSIMESRIRLMSGRFLVDSAPGEGTTIQMEVPA